MLSGHYSLLLLALGALSVGLVGWIVHRMDLVDHETIPLHLLHRIPRFYAWLAWQICLSNLDLVRRIWRRDPDVEPVVLRVPMHQRSDVCRVIYANSINLTPGTLTIAMEDDSLLVHTLSREGAQSLLKGEMSRQISRLED
jgi:multicomponent Na+:H+ antiporter subunit E